MEDVVTHGRATECSARDPEVVLEREVSDVPVDRVESGFYLAIWIATMPDQRLDARRSREEVLEP